MLSLQERADCYHRAFPKYPPLVTTSRWLYGIFIIGAYYKTHFYGQYPPSFLKRAMSLFPDCERVLHLFSGTIHQGITLDINPALSPTVVGDAQAMPFPNESFDLILADPPYGKVHAEKYGYPMINRRKVFYECYRVLKTGGFLGWLDTLLPMHRKDQWQIVGSIGVLSGTNRAIRGFTIYKKLGIVHSRCTCNAYITEEGVDMRRSTNDKLPSSQLGDGGSIPTPPLHIISYKEASDFLAKYHYLGTKPFRCSIAYGIGDPLRGVIVFHGVSAPETVVGAFGLARDQQEGIWEIGRLALRTGYNGENLGSYLIRRGMRLLQKSRVVKAVIAYADSTLHNGAVYQAAGFTYCGLTAPKMNYYISGKIQERGKTGGGEWKPRPRKHRYIVIIDRELVLRWPILTYLKRRLLIAT